MACAISIKADNPTGDRIVRLWRAVAAFETEPSMERLGYAPHLTFAIYDDIDQALVERTVYSVFATQPPLRVTFDGIRSFDTSPMVLWASPRDTTLLKALHAAIHEIVDPSLCREHYRPGTWIPHCTLGTRIGNALRDRALAFASDMTEPFEVVFDTADTISFPPVEIADSVRLGTGPS